MGDIGCKNGKAHTDENGNMVACETYFKGYDLTASAKHSSFATAEGTGLARRPSRRSCATRGHGVAETTGAGSTAARATTINITKSAKEIRTTAESMTGIGTVMSGHSAARTFFRQSQQRSAKLGQAANKDRAVTLAKWPATCACGAGTGTGPASSTLSRG